MGAWLELSQVFKLISAAVLRISASQAALSVLSRGLQHSSGDSQRTLLEAVDAGATMESAIQEIS